MCSSGYCLLSAGGSILPCHTFPDMSQNQPFPHLSCSVEHFVMVIKSLINIVAYIKNISIIYIVFTATYATMAELNGLDRLCGPHEQNHLIVSSVRR